MRAILPCRVPNTIVITGPPHIQASADNGQQGHITLLKVLPQSFHYIKDEKRRIVEHNHAEQSQVQVRLILMS
jgi:hypothetical protein